MIEASRKEEKMLPFRKKKDRWTTKKNTIKDDKIVAIERPDLWLSYQDKFQDMPISVRVNTALVKKKYWHTLFVMIPYYYSKEKPFPDEQELATSNRVKDQIDRILEDYDNIMFIGSATFNGNVHLLYVSDDYVDWPDLIQVEETTKLGMYENDNMRFYRSVLYPKSIRKKYRNQSWLNLILKKMDIHHL